MKKLKFAYLSMFMALFLVTACTNNESAIEEQPQTEESQSITTALNRLSEQFDLNGNVTQTDNPAGNIVLDYCFDFVYPLTLSYNNDSTVTVEDLSSLIDVILASTEELYINGIAFPFNVETFVDDSGAIEVVTINNEEEFEDLIEDCDFDEIDTCDCFEVYEPVCVEISDPTGLTFTVTYPNACYAECDGFTENDFLDSCENDYNPGAGIECFSLNYPLDIIFDDGITVTINSDEELDNTLYDVYNFDFIYPFTVTLENQDVVTINSPEDIEAIINDCFDDLGGNYCSQEAIQAVFNECTTWEAEVSGQVYDYLFDPSNNTLEIYNENGDLITSGTWEITVDSTGVLVMIINTSSGNFTTVWFFINCDGEGYFEITTNGGAASDISSSCD